MKTARRIILVLVAMLCMQMSAAYASINYMADADLASKDLHNIMTMYLGMPEKDFLHNFSDVKEWKLSDKIFWIGEECYYYRLTKGDSRDLVSEVITVEVSEGVIGYIQWDFRSSNKSAQKIIFGKIQGNMMKQLGTPYVDRLGTNRWVFLNTQGTLFYGGQGVRMTVGIPINE